jgi:hypothetical protein
MKEFDFRKYLKQNPLLKESVNEKFSNWKNWKPGFEDFWDRVYDGAIEKAIEISKESGDGMNIEEISKAIENECANPNRVMQAFEADGEVDEAIHYVLDSLEIGEPMGMGATQNAFIRKKANRIGYNPMREDEDSMSEGDSVIFDKGWQYDDEDEDDLPDEREMFLGQGGQEILDNIKYLVDNGFELEDIIRLIKQHSNYIQGPTINERKKVAKDSFIQAQREAAGEISIPIMDAMDIIDSNGEPLDPDRLSSSGPNSKRVSSYVNKLLYSTVEYDGQTYEIDSIDDDSDSYYYDQEYAQGELPSIHLVKVDDTINEDMYGDENPFPSFHPGNQGKGERGYLSDYYSNSEPSVKHVANELDETLDVLVKDKSRLEELTDLIVALGDAYAQERIDLYNSDNSFN